jgi:hypothetical protein
VGLLTRKTEEEKEAERQAKAEARARDEQANAEAQAALNAHIASVPKWDYRVAWVGEDKQKGLLGSRRMEEIFNQLGAEGWELVSVNMERATFKRPRFVR